MLPDPNPKSRSKLVPYPRLFQRFASPAPSATSPSYPALHRQDDE